MDIKKNKGPGNLAGDDSVKCKTCNGKGSYSKKVRSGFMTDLHTYICGECNGTGQIISPKKSPAEQFVFDIEHMVAAATPSGFYLETMVEISEVLRTRYLKAKTVCPALDEILQIKMF